MTPTRIHKIGDPASQYAYHPEQLDKDLEKHKFDDALFRCRIRDLILSEPARMKIRVNQAVDELRKIKDEFGL
jgi:hypothetical protein